MDPSLQFRIEPVPACCNVLDDVLSHECIACVMTWRSMVAMDAHKLEDMVKRLVLLCGEHNDRPELMYICNEMY